MTKPVLDTDDARQGDTGHNVRWVLIAGLAAAVLVVAVIAAIASG